MHLHNLLRDQLHWKAGGVASPGWSYHTEINNDRLYANSSGVVNQDLAIEHQKVGSLTVANYAGSGLLISQPVVDSTPYRVKLYVNSFECFTYLAIGYSPAAPTGSGDQITKCRFVPLQVSGSQGSGAIAGNSAVMDEVILLPGLSQGDPDFGKPIFFGVMIVGNGTPVAGYYLSVQNLAKTAPQFAAGMS